MVRPLIGIPMGDPSGIGPEIIIKALNHKELYDLCRPLVIGDIGVIDKIKGLTGYSSELNVIEKPALGIYKYGIVDIITISNIDSMKLAFGRVQAEAGKAAFEYIAKVVELAKNKEVDAIATTPINKEALRLANIDFIGHTEILSGLTGTDDPLTMFQVYNMRVFFLSRHLSLIKACEAVKKERIIDYVIRCTEALRRLGLPNPSIAIAGLNPHSGEHGLFGDEEVIEIEPAVRELKSNGYNITGPVSADSVFYQARIGKYDAVLSLYHDQGHIATKTVDFERTISLTIGMPFLRTSVDHGTAFDIAGKGIASEVSMVEAIRLAAEYADKYNG